MLRFNLIIFFRQLQQYLRFSISSFVGLILGVTAFLVVLLFSNSLEKYNNWDNAFDNIFELRYSKPFKALENDGVMKMQPPLLAKYLKEFPGIVRFSRVKEQRGAFLQSATKSGFEDNLMGVDSNFFQLFPLHFAYGDACTAMDSVRNIILSKRMALKYFGRENCVGDSLYFANITLKVTGVLADNGPTTFPTDFIGRLTIPKWAQDNGWGNFAYKYYCQLSPENARSESKRDQLAVAISKTWYKIPQVFESQKDFIGLGKNYAAWLQNPKKIKLQFFEVRKLYQEDKHTLFIVLVVIGVTILLLCCFDYMNKQIGFADTRNIEIGIKSLNGWTPKQLILQVFIETSLFVLAAFFCSFVLVELLLPLINQLLEEKIQLYKSFLDFSFLWKLVLFFIVVVLSAGCYPAFYMATLSPVSVLKGNYHGPDRGHRFRLLLLGVQATLGMSILIIVVAVWLQINFLRHKDIGFSYKNLYYFVMDGNALGEAKNRNQLDSLIQNYPNIVSHSYTQQMPLVGGENNFEPIRTKHGTINSLVINNGRDFFKTIGSGNFLQGNLSKNGKDVVVNQMLVKDMHLEEPIIGKKIITDIPPNLGFGSSDTFTIKAVTKDILYSDWEYKGYPIIYTYTNLNQGTFLLFRTNGKIGNTFVRDLENKILELLPNNPIQIKSSEKDYKNSFKQVDFLFKSLSFFAVVIVLAVFLGFVTYTNFYFQKGRKEIVLRMIMGAKPRDFMSLFRKDVAPSLIAALIVSLLIVFFALKIFFKHFAYTITYPYWLYIAIPFLFFLLAVCIMLITLQKLLRKEPAKVLKYE